MTKEGRKTQAQKKSEETKLQRRKNLENATKFIVEHYNIKKSEMKTWGSISDRWYEVFEETRSKSKMCIALYYPSADKRAIKFSTYQDDGKVNIDMELWSEKGWQPFIEESKKYYAFIKRNK